MEQVTKFKMAALLLAALLFMTGCSLIDTNIGDFQDDNQGITSGAEFGRVVMAEGIGSGNRPVDVTDVFDSSQDYIYVVLEADYIEAGTTMFARWYREGQPFEDSSQLTADRDYQDTYVEFHLENLGGRMQEGTYSVEIFVNGNPVVEQEFEVR
ncbi:MAG: hypothetical protein EHM56_03565 [Chloroflexi bacterium]|nr:MAG: hypothetical protein EHM56_03565 [Chloroflexota bacterium]